MVLSRRSRGGGLPASRRSARSLPCGSAASQVVEDAVDHRGLGDEGDDAHLVAASGTRERIDLEDAPQQLGPAALRRIPRTLDA